MKIREDVVVGICEVGLFLKGEYVKLILVKHNSIFGAGYIFFYLRFL